MLNPHHVTCVCRSVLLLFLVLFLVFFEFRFRLRCCGSIEWNGPIGIPAEADLLTRSSTDGINRLRPIHPSSISEAEAVLLFRVLRFRKPLIRELLSSSID